MFAKITLLFFLFSITVFSQYQLTFSKKIYLKENYLYINTQANENLLSESILQNLRLEIPITATYYIDFYEQVFFFFNKKIASLKIIKTINYDIWSRRYFVKNNNQVEKVDNFTQLKNTVNYLRDVPLTHIRNIAPDKKYFFNSRISLQKENSSIYFHLVNNLLSALSFKTTYFKSPIYFGDDLINILSK